jgi:membrane fusion protein (multidrug efflux system)
MPDSPTDLQPMTQQGDVARPAPRRSMAVRIVLLLGGAALVAGAVVYGIGWWTHGRFVQSTDDAYLQADVVAVAPKIQGYVEQVLVADNQEVAAGQALVRIDASPYQASLAQDAASAGAQRASIAAAESQIAEAEASVAQAQAQLAGAQASLSYARAEDERFRKLSAQGAETRERAAQAHNSFSQALATQRANAAALDAARRNVDTLKAQLGQSQSKLAGAEAQVRSAQLNLDDTLIRAGIAGRIGDKTVQIGQFVQAGTRLMSVVPTSAIYLVANFKETQLARMRVGQPARVSIDALGGRTIDAVVESFAPGTGATFALLPPQNATGNFTKIVQRVPVRLRLEVPADLRGRLLAGLSATAGVDTEALQ